ncbi:hypothetical protein V8G54_013425 [Vigna mungo]|uniref:Uncharacterized protein n=1 Tax=Vigna mungo TaxID=3915 RepID=A0AAQ3S4W8_VIGMU
MVQRDADGSTNKDDGRKMLKKNSWMRRRDKEPIYYNKKKKIGKQTWLISHQDWEEDWLTSNVTMAFTEQNKNPNLRIHSHFTSGKGFIKYNSIFGWVKVEEDGDVALCFGVSSSSRFYLHIWFFNNLQKKDSSFDMLVEELGMRLTSRIEKRWERNFSKFLQIPSQLHNFASISVFEFVVGHGELWYAQMLSLVIKNVAQGIDCKWMNAREVLIVKPTRSDRVDPDYLESERRLEKWYSLNPYDVIVATEFIASTPQNIPTTLKRDGSDFSAAIMGALFKACQIPEKVRSASSLLTR